MLFLPSSSPLSFFTTSSTYLATFLTTSSTYLATSLTIFLASCFLFSVPVSGEGDVQRVDLTRIHMLGNALMFTGYKVKVKDIVYKSKIYQPRLLSTFQRLSGGRSSTRTMSWVRPTRRSSLSLERTMLQKKWESWKSQDYSARTLRLFAWTITYASVRDIWRWPWPIQIFLNGVTLVATIFDIEYLVSARYLKKCKDIWYLTFDIWRYPMHIRSQNVASLVARKSRWQLKRNNRYWLKILSSFEELNILALHNSKYDSSTEE